MPIVSKILVGHLVPAITRRMLCYNMEGKVAIVTGASSGIGHAAVDSLLRCCLKGVVMGDIQVHQGEAVAEEINDQFCGKEKAIFRKCDVTKHDDFEGLFTTALDKWGRVDILFNCAGIIRECCWSDIIDINIAGVVRGTYLGWKYMSVEHGGCGGLVVNCASVLGFQPLYAAPVYTGSKHFIVGFTRSLGNPYFYDRSHIRIVALCPGVTITQMAVKAGGSKTVPELSPDLEKHLEKDVHAAPSQSAEVCGEHFVRVCRWGENGTTWVSEAKECYEMPLVDRLSIRGRDIRPKEKTSKGKKTSKSSACRKYHTFLHLPLILPGIPAPHVCVSKCPSQNEPPCVQPKPAASPCAPSCEKKTEGCNQGGGAHTAAPCAQQPTTASQCVRKEEKRDECCTQGGGGQDVPLKKRVYCDVID